MRRQQAAAAVPLLLAALLLASGAAAKPDAAAVLPADSFLNADGLPLLMPTNRTTDGRRWLFELPRDPGGWWGGGWRAVGDATRCHMHAHLECPVSPSCSRHPSHAAPLRPQRGRLLASIGARWEGGRGLHSQAAVLLSGLRAETCVPSAPGPSLARRRCAHSASVSAWPPRLHAAPCRWWLLAAAPARYPLHASSARQAEPPQPLPPALQACRRVCPLPSRRWHVAMRWWH